LSPFPPIFLTHAGFSHPSIELLKVKEIPHNTAARLAVPFSPSASCKFLDLPPVSLRNLQAHLTDLQRSFQPKFTRQSTTLIVRYFLKSVNVIL
jgi:hypothetical protein